MLIYCCECRKDVVARLTNGIEIYPHRKDLSNVHFWICDNCKNYVGTHYKTNNPTLPLGNIPNEELRFARKKIHELLDPIWRNGKIKRKDLYGKISKKIGFHYHTSDIKTINDARNVYKIILDIKKEV